ncbi:hypothetical protein SAMN02949497_0224 [Methylomagnum ishizawai]|uniref:Glycosyltransferase 2-like domain-containing protein n=1 Tax=Methylomagnum ishizawai TaxID=1760988 RepID=A0A1Y6DC46_9GAMM|nr:glycosyltransferase family 2 protein [Methylomagnum ishizawai]SMF97654.1 hypothetical protein SAMN02949497_0224 [Methylomagnum ishizawai]
MNPEAGGPPPAIATVLVNWQGADDTVECLESLFASDYPGQSVVVVDNGSPDDSLAKLVAWAEGRYPVPLSAPAADGPPPAPCPKPVSYARLDLDTAALGRGWLPGVRLYLIAAGRNHGFAGGVNIGLRFALANPALRYAWVLNNDTVVARDCLSRMERRMRDAPAAGMCGSRILFYWQPETVQVLGGAAFRPWLGTSRLLGHRWAAARQPDPRQLERDFDHLSGASILVSRRFLEDVGFMDEGYFLYFEEMDWAMRGKRRYGLVYADDALVYHKEGASIGSSHRHQKRSPLSVFFMVRSRLRFTRKFFPWALPSVLAYSLATALRALCQGRRAQARAMFSALCGLSPQRALGWTPDP